MSGSPTRAFRFPVYQIDFSAVASGKHIAATKRRIRWRFGFPSLSALNAGRTGTDCRGEEHEIVVVWSITSGKRQVLMDGREVHYASSRTSVFDHSWSTRGNHVLKIVCHAAAPMTANPGFRQYDLFIDGQSFFTMPKVYELGIRGVGDRAPVRAAGAYDGEMRPEQRTFEYSAPAPQLRPPKSTAEEEDELQRAIRASLEESKRHLEQKGGPEPTHAGGTADLLDFAGPEPAFPALPPSEPYHQNGGYGAPPPHPQQYGAPPPMSGQQSVATYQSYGSSSQPTPYLALPAFPGQGPPPSQPPPPQQQQYGNYGPPSVNTWYAPAPAPYAPAASAPYAPAASYVGSGGSYGTDTTDDPFAPKPPSHSEITSEILSAYSSPTSAGVTSPMTGTFSQGFDYAGQYAALENDASRENQNGHAQQNGSALTMTMNGLAKTEEEEPSNPFEAALKKLVNVDNIDQPAEEKLKLTMKEKEEAKKKQYALKSAPKPPAVAQIVGSGATLSQIQQVKPEIKPREDVMKAPPQLFHPNAAMAGALVIHGQPPPNLQPQGFGVAYNQGYGYGYGGGGYPPQAAAPPQYQYR